MKKPKIATMSQKERDTLTRKVGESDLDAPAKGAVLETIDFAIELQKQLQTAKISIASLKDLFANEGEALKKLFLTS